VTADSGEAIPREGEITFVLDLPGMTVNPPQRSFRWVEDVQREEFRVKAPATLDGSIVRGVLRVHLGALLVAEVRLAIQVDTAAHGPSPIETDAEQARPYRRIFPSYSHRDEEIVRQVEAYARTMGDEYLRDVTTLRAGEQWNDRLLELVRTADVFQLFWSRNSMRSPWVRQEWEYALALGRDRFVRPTYWEEPMPQNDELPPQSLLRLQPLRASTFRSRHASPNARGTVFGGQLLGQALMAASMTAPPGRDVTAMQFMFLQSATPEWPVDYGVKALPAGKRFGSRHVRGTHHVPRRASYRLDAQVSFAVPMAGRSTARLRAPKLDRTELPRFEDLPAGTADAVGARLCRSLDRAGFAVADPACGWAWRRRHPRCASGCAHAKALATTRCCGRRRSAVGLVDPLLTSAFMSGNCCRWRAAVCGDWATRSGSTVRCARTMAAFRCAQPERRAGPWLVDCGRARRRWRAGRQQQNLMVPGSG
jgi:hypothetical protein